MDHFTYPNTYDAKKRTSSESDESINASIRNALDNQPSFQNTNLQRKVEIQETNVKNFKKTKSKKTGTSKRANKVTWGELSTFVDGFLLSVTDKRFEGVTAVDIFEEDQIQKQIYKKYYGFLRNRLCATYKMNKPMKLDNVEFIDELYVDTNLLNNRIKAQTPEDSKELTDFLIDNSVLDSFVTSDLVGIMADYKVMNELCNRYRTTIQSVFKDRVYSRFYIKLYESIHSELKDIFIKSVIRKKKKLDEFEERTVRDFLQREREFVELFGSVDQFSDDAMLFDDLFVDEMVEKYFT